MFISLNSSRKSLAGASLIGALFLSGAAFAGSCPADQVRANAHTSGPNAHKQVTDKVIVSIDLAEEKVALDGHKFRLRKLVVQPGGIVAWHNHGERPAIIFIVSGAIQEYRSDCAVPIVHKAGEVTEEVRTTSHWWKNHTSKPVVLYSADILHDKEDPHTM
ncbi:MAG: cupin domain-containing protein [Hyphomicrobiaceae bacterium]|nr:MAG: cupin domain-containing protein [Hyphomicrobiaceae bacterium]